MSQIFNTHTIVIVDIILHSFTVYPSYLFPCSPFPVSNLPSAVSLSLFLWENNPSTSTTPDISVLSCTLSLNHHRSETYAEKERQFGYHCQKHHSNPCLMK